MAAVPLGEITFPVVDLLHLAAVRGVVCYGPYRRTEPTFVRADAWIPRWKDMPREQAERLLLRAYLRSFAPATTEDFSLWTGTTLTNAREIWSRVQANLASVNVEGWLVGILGDDLDTLTQAEFERPRVRLLRTSILFSSGIKRENTL